MKKNNIPFLLKLVRWIYPRLERVIPPVAHRFFIAIFFSPLNYRVPPKERLAEREAEKFSVKAAGKRIQCYSWGQGPVILLIHGWAGRATQFRKIIQAFVARGYKVVGFDGPAHGHSSGYATNILEFEEVLKKMYDKIGVPAAVITHSFGGSVALLAAMHGLPLSKLVSIAAPSIGDEIIHTYLKTINGTASTARFFKSYFLKRTGKPFDAFTARYFIQHLKQDIALLLIHDEADAEVPLYHALELIKYYPKAELFKTRGLGHTRILKDEDVIKKCLSFVES